MSMAAPEKRMVSSHSVGTVASASFMIVNELPQRSVVAIRAKRPRRVWAWLAPGSGIEIRVPFS